MEDIIERQRPCPGDDNPNNSGWGYDCHAREAALQDKLVDCLFQMEPENVNYSALDTLLNQLDKVAPLPNDKSFDTEGSLAKLYQKINARSANPVPTASSQRCAPQPHFSQPCVSVPRVSLFRIHRPMREPSLCAHREQERGIWGSCRPRATILKAGPR